MDLEVADSSSGSTHKKLKQNEVLDGIDAEIEVITKEVGADTKGKSKMDDDDSLANGNKDASGSVLGSGDQAKSDFSYEFSDHDEDLLDDENYADSMSDYEMDDDDTNVYEDEYAKIQSQFDNVDLPTGVEVSMPWLKESADTVETPAVPNSHAQDFESLLSSSASVLASKGEPTSSSKVEEGGIEKFKDFKLFDMVEDHSDHHYNRTGEQAVPAKNWAKRIQEEWKILENNLPETIFVRVYESRMDLLRSVIVGPAGTPYHDGLFVFDCLFPPNYPNAPPLVYYYSGGLRLNPNLYACGKVCLSLLGTWSGDKNEKWIAGKSTMLQVLVSMQALILNTQPYYNEPGYANQTGPAGLRKSREYSETVFILSLKTMMYTLRRPPKHFEILVKGHFQEVAHNILIACKAYAEGREVGRIMVKDGVADVSNAEKNGSPDFKGEVKKMIDILINTFSRFGSIDCERFRTSN